MPSSGFDSSSNSSRRKSLLSPNGSSGSVGSIDSDSSSVTTASHNTNTTTANNTNNNNTFATTLYEKMDNMDQRQEQQAKKRPMMTALMVMIVLLCGLQYMDMVKEESAISESTADVFVQIQRTRTRTRVAEKMSGNGPQVLINKKVTPGENEDFGSYANFTKIIGGVATDPERITSALPRSSKVEYNKLNPNEKYFMYSPSGGWGNQLLEMLGAAYVARETNRTLIVPMAMRHSNMFWAYYALRQPEGVPFDHALDFEHMEKAFKIRFLPLNITLKEFHVRYLNDTRESNPQIDLHKIHGKHGLRHEPPSKMKKWLERVVNSNKQVVWLYGKFYNKHWAKKGNMFEHVRYSSYLRSFASVIAKHSLNSTYNAFHIRMGDYAEKAKEVSKDARRFASAGKRVGMDRDAPVYLATDSNSRIYFRPITRHWRTVLRARDLADRSPIVKQWLLDFHSRLPTTGIRNSLFGLVDQLLCIRAQHFVGTSVSTFSQGIEIYRGLLDEFWPEFVQEEGPLDLTTRRTHLEVWGRTPVGGGSTTKK